MNGGSVSLPVYLDADERRRIIAATVTERDALFIEFLFRTGARVSEAAEARCCDLTPNGVRLVNLKRKHHTEKHVFLEPGFLDVLRSWCNGRAATDAIFGRTGDGGRMSRVRFWQIYTQAATKAGIFRRRFSSGKLMPAWTHTSRHSSAVAMLLAGVGVTAVQRHLGHAGLASTQVYTQLADPDYQRQLAGVPF